MAPPRRSVAKCTLASIDGQASTQLLDHISLYDTNCFALMQTPSAETERLKDTNFCVLVTVSV